MTEFQNCKSHALKFSTHTRWFNSLLSFPFILCACIIGISDFSLCFLWLQFFIIVLSVSSLMVSNNYKGNSMNFVAWLIVIFNVIRKNGKFLNLLVIFGTIWSDIRQLVSGSCFNPSKIDLIYRNFQIVISKPRKLPIIIPPSKIIWFSSIFWFDLGDYRLESGYK